MLTELLADQVMDNHLKDKEWLAADQYTIADIANFSWVFIHKWSGQWSGIGTH